MKKVENVERKNAEKEKLSINRINYKETSELSQMTDIEIDTVQGRSNEGEKYFTKFEKEW